MDTKHGKIYINEVMLVPGLDENLLSVGQMMEHVYYVLFGGNMAIIFDDYNLENMVAKVIMAGNKCFPLSLESITFVARKASIKEEPWSCHKRLCHLNFGNLKKMQREGMVLGLPKLSEKKEVCEGYISGKMQRELFDKEKVWKQAIHLILYTQMCVDQRKMNPLLGIGTSSYSLMIF